MQNSFQKFFSLKGIVWTVLAVCFLTIAAAVAYGTIIKNDGTEINTANINSVLKITKEDSDGDGLSDKEEEKWKTDISNPDTDQDGYLDGEETASGYDPLVKAPNDKLEANTSSDPRPLPSNLTKIIAQSLSKEITDNQYYVSTNTLYGINEPEQLISDAIEKSGLDLAELFKTPEIKKEKIATVANTDSNLQSYGIQAVDIIGSHTPSESLQTAEYITIYNALESQNFVLTDKYAESYYKLYEEISKIAVPKILLDVHIEQLNIIYNTAQCFEYLKEINTDPLKTTVALQKYQLLNDKTFNLSQKILNIFTEFFKNNE